LTNIKSNKPADRKSDEGDASGKNVVLSSQPNARGGECLPRGFLRSVTAVEIGKFGRGIRRSVSGGKVAVFRRRQIGPFRFR
jgi:hypothetical protein